ncbi:MULTISPECIES: protoporphyrinogen oxidase HemJ [Alphaproteobacteria]|uniref:Protoporphyrinogen IX oxidase n=2 Tax=Alphaproteobacteria TaxID=28211 RepID=A0A512HMB7_9HYPH|nr:MULTISPECIES: protoporphyrinogen oxidase HemJ [Alphaproteobacteria]GEO86596.1 membrane protein [Ciceribacter naphthalenivorans]GLR20832.1 membrane protein [Ciceribacter naphthalenivorans]GLT03688.1 membrane protein [Sphingomonas psychrolutea]
MAERQTDLAPGRKAATKAAIALVFFGAIALAIAVFGEDAAYSWIKALHVIAIISWMAGMLYMPRLFIYHSDCEPDSDQARTFSVMEVRLMKVIMNPAMIVSWVLGLYLAWTVFGFQGGWLHLKLLAVLGLSGVHGFFARSVKAFGRGQYVRDARFWRLMNEVPTLLMIVIVVLVVVKPF